MFSSAERPSSQCMAITRMPFTPPDPSDASHTAGGPMTSGWTSALRSRSQRWLKLVFVPPPGSSAFTVTPVPSSSVAMAATSASWPAFEGP